MKIEEQKIIQEKSKIKNDGVYTYKGIFYLVHENRLHSFCNYFGEIYESFGSFNVYRGKAKYRSEGRDILKKNLITLRGK